jgi:glycine betaine/proline transport system substrate-binding protein
MEDNQADGEEAMFHFLEDYQRVWQAWVSPEVASKIKQAL